MTFFTKNLTNLAVAVLMTGLAVWAIMAATAKPDTHRVVGVVEVGEVQ